MTNRHPQGRRAVFLDRDGVLDRKAPEGDYVKTPDELEMLPGAARAVRRLNDAGWLVVVVTNQRGVARGLMTLEDLDAVHRKLRRELAREGAMLDDIRSCVHDIRDQCDCRKPSPGLILAAARELGVDLASSWMLGDRPSDIQAGLAAGCRTIHICHPDDDCTPDPRATAIAGSLAEAVDYLLAVDPPAALR